MFNDFKNKSYHKSPHKLKTLKDLYDRLDLPDLEDLTIKASKLGKEVIGKIVEPPPPPPPPPPPIPPWPPGAIFLSVFIEINIIRADLGVYDLTIQINNTSNEYQVSGDTYWEIGPPFNLSGNFPSGGRLIGFGTVAVGYAGSANFAGYETGRDGNNIIVPSTGPFTASVTATSTGQTIVRTFTYYLPIRYWG